MRLRILILILVSSGALLPAFQPVPHSGLIRTDHWEHDELYYGFFLGATLTADSDLVMILHKHGINVVNGNEYYTFARHGQGPNEVGITSTICRYKDRVAVIELYRKIQVFRKATKGYKWERNIWREEKECSQRVSSALFTRGKWFFAGMEFDFRESVKNAYYLMRICDEKGKFLKRLIRRKYREPKRLNLMGFHVTEGEGNVLFIAEDDPTVFVISQESLEVIRKIKLEVPEFYRPMPQDFYSKTVKPGGGGFTIPEFYSAVEHWKSGYSRITNTLVEKNRFVIQIRTCSDKMPRFALLFYNLADFRMEDMVFTDDYLLTGKSGKYYMFENGNPMMDEVSGDVVINIYERK